MFRLQAPTEEGLGSQMSGAFHGLRGWGFCVFGFGLRALRYAESALLTNKNSENGSELALKST